MKGFEAWATFVAVILGREVEAAEEKYKALPEAERNAWEAVVAPKPKK